MKYALFIELKDEILTQWNLF